MKQWIKALILALLMLAGLVIGSVLLYKHFVADRITDKGGMENPNPPICENAQASAETPEAHPEDGTGEDRALSSSPKNQHTNKELEVQT